MVSANEDTLRTDRKALINDTIYVDQVNVYNNKSYIEANNHKDWPRVYIVYKGVLV